VLVVMVAKMPFLLMLMLVVMVAGGDGSWW
jgi:hypothetical protein